MTHAPLLAGVHHLKLPVADLRRSQAWYESRLGYRLSEEFHNHGQLAGIGMEHPNGGPGIAFVLAPELANAAAGFDYFAIGVPDKSSLQELAARLDGFGESHAGVHRATLGWILPLLHDPDGHEVRFYSLAHHTTPDPGRVHVVHDAVATARRIAAELGEE